MIISVESPLKMEQLGEMLANACLQKTNELIFFLSGDLGAGKTTLVRGFLRGMAYTGTVKSPTYTLVEPYDTARGSIYHFDLYRLKEEEELALIGIRDYFHEKAICLIEWPEKAPHALPLPDLEARIEMTPLTRTIYLEARSNRGHDVLQALQMA